MDPDQAQQNVRPDLGPNSLQNLRSFHLLLYGLRREKPCLQGFANNTGADQPAHPRSLISAFVIRFVESIICKLATGEISIFWLEPAAKETGLKLTLSETPKTGFVTMRPICCMCQVERLWLPQLKLRVRNRKIIFLFLNQNICCGYF